MSAASFSCGRRLHGEPERETSPGSSPQRRRAKRDSDHGSESEVNREAPANQRLLQPQGAEHLLRPEREIDVLRTEQRSHLRLQPRGNPGARSQQAIGPSSTAAALWSAWASRIRAFLSTRVRSPADADDLLQETFLRAARQLASLEDPDRAGAWLFRIARNVVLDHHRAATRRASMASLEAWSEPNLTPPGNEAEATQASLSRCLALTLPTLGQPDLEAISFTYLGGRPQRELAQKAGLSISAAKSRVQRARQRLIDRINACCRIDRDSHGAPIRIAPRHTRVVHTCPCRVEPPSV